jgi:uncharacterized protein YdgA (DUF945 family)
MNNSVRAVLVIGLLVLAGLPVWGGWQAQEAFVAAGERLNVVTSSRFEVHTAFHRGWLRSEAETRIVPVDSQEAPGLTLRHTVVHGPIPLGEILAGRLPGRPVRAIVDTSIATGPAEAGLSLRARARIELDGRTHVDLESMPFDSEDGSLHWEGVRGTLDSPDLDFARVVGVLEAPRLEVESAGSLLVVDDVAASLEMRALTDELPLGSFSLSVGLVELTGAAGEFRLRDFQWEQRGDEDVINETYGVTLSASLDHMELEGEPYGPGAFELVLRNLDPTALSRLRASMQAQADVSVAAGGDPSAATLPDLKGVQRLLARSPELELVLLELTGPEGVLRARGRLRVDGGHPHLELGPMFVTSALEGTGDVFVPAGLLHRALDGYAREQLEGEGAANAAMRVASRRQQWVGALIAAGLLESEREGYRLRVDYREGQLLLNGEPLDPEALRSARLAAR